MKGNDMHTVGNIQFGPMTIPYDPRVYGPGNIDNATLILTPAQEKEIEEMMKAYNKKKVATPKPEVGTPVWVRNYRTRDGVIFNGWGIVMDSSANHTDSITVNVVLNHQPFIISTKDYHFEEPLKEIKKASFPDADGQTIEVSYGEYETEEGAQMILGIDTPFETVSFATKNLDIFIDALQKVKQ